MPTERERITKKIRDTGFSTRDMQNGDAYRQAKEAFALLKECREFLQTIYDDVSMIDMNDNVETLCHLMVEIDSFLPKN